MDSIWHEMWKNNNTPFHKDETNPLLIENWEKFNVPLDKTIFVPLCGKSLDMLWFAQQGYKVIGAELSEIAAEQFFTENKIKFEITNESSVKVYKSERIKIIVGDIFELKKDLFDSSAIFIYDRAALIALDVNTRKRYCEKLKELSDGHLKMFLLTLDMKIPEHIGPPYFVPTPEVKQHFTEAAVEIVFEEATEQFPISYKEKFGISVGKNLVYRIGLVD